MISFPFHFLVCHFAQTGLHVLTAVILTGALLHILASSHDSHLDEAYIG